METVLIDTDFETKLKACLFWNKRTFGGQTEYNEKVTKKLFKEHVPSFGQIETLLWSCLFGEERLRNEARHTDSTPDGYAYETDVLANIHYCFDTYLQAAGKDGPKVKQSIKFLTRIHDDFLIFFRGHKRSHAQYYLEDQFQQAFFCNMIRSVIQHSRISHAMRLHLLGWMAETIGGDYDLQYRHSKFIVETYCKPFDKFFSEQQKKSMLEHYQELWKYT